MSFHHVPQPERRAALLSLSLSLLLLSLKFAAYFLTGSAAIFSDAMESIVNVVASAFALYALRLAHAPADAEHPYGHGKVEFLSAGLEGGMILLASVVIFIKALDTLLFHSVQLEELDLGLSLVAAAMTVNAAAGLHLLRTGRKTNSLTLEADGHHLLADAVTSAAALAALLLVRAFDWPPADPIAALLIAAYLARTGLKLLKRSAAGLMDAQDLADEILLQRILNSHLSPHGRPPHICSFHKLRHRHSGRYHWVDFHLMVPPALSVAEGHQIASAIEYEIEQALGEGNATAHIEPCDAPTCPAAGCHPQ